MSLQLNYKSAAQTAIARTVAPKNDADKPPPTFAEFKQRIWHNYLPAKHLNLIDDALTQVVRYVESGGREGIGYLIICWPPRHGKSLNLGRFFPAYLVGCHPDWRVIYTSYTADLAHKHSRQARNLLLSKTYQEMFPGVALAKDSSAVNSWNLEGYEGGMDAMGVGGGVTGRGGDVLCADDLLSGREAANSPLIREKTWDFFTDDFLTRRNTSSAAVILSGTRWDKDDPIGRAQLYQPGKWHVLSLPALAEENDPLGRDIGEALWPERFPVSFLEDVRARNVYSFASLYQQRPAPREGGLFKWADINDNRVTTIPELRRIVIAIDPAVTANENSDETGIIAAGLGVDGHGYILDDKSLIASPDAWARQAVTAYHTWAADRIIAEVNNGGDLVENTLRTVEKSLSITQVRASRGKITRAEPIAALYEQSKIHHVGTFSALEDQQCSMMAGMSDSPDRVDALVWALWELLIGDQGEMSIGKAPDGLADYFGGVGD